MKKPCDKCLTMDEFYSKLDTMCIETYVVCLEYYQSHDDEPELITLYIEPEWSKGELMWIWETDWDEGGEAFVLGFQPINDIDVIGVNV